MEEMTTRKCLVTGATGVVGVPLVRELLERGHDVRVFVRDASGASQFGSSVEVHTGDLRDRSAVFAAAEGVDWIFHLGAKLHINNPGPDSKAEYTAVNVGGTDNVVTAAKASRAAKLIFFSTINVYGPGRAVQVRDESSGLDPQGIYAETKAAGEEMVLAARNESDESIGVVLRMAAVYGSRMKGNYARLAEAVRKGRFVFVGKGENRRTLIHQADAVSAAILAAEKASGLSVYNVTDGSVHTLRQIVAAAAKAFGKKVPSVRIPVGPVRIGLAALEALARPFGAEPPLNRDLLKKLLEDIAVDGTKFRSELGFVSRFDLEQGWKEVADGRERESYL